MIKKILFLISFQFIFLKTIDDNNNFKLGLENIPEKLLKKLLTKKNGKLSGIGLITNQTGIDQNGKANYEILLKKGLNIKALYVPEHGFDGKVEAEKKINCNIEKKTKLPIISLYEGDSKFKKFTNDDLKDIDFFIFDMQDSGMRHYTYISILYRMMEVAIKFNKKFIVLDRPNPLGIIMEGPIVQPDLISFISIAPIPLRHAMTIGELSKYFNKFQFNNDLKLLIIKMKNYKRTRGLNNFLPIYLSPNLTNIQACCNYSFLGIMGEISPFSVLVGTKDSFKAIMLPKNLNLKIKDFIEFKNILKRNNISPTYFTCFKKGTNQKLVGFKIKINDINNFSGFNTIIEILKHFKKIGINLSYSKSFNKVIGRSDFKDFIEGINNNFINIKNKELKQFFENSQNLFIYQPLPILRFFDSSFNELRTGHA